MKKNILILLLLFTVNFAFAQLSWIRLANYPGHGKPGMASMSLNGKGYMGLGFDTLAHGCNDWYEYNASSNIWTQKASLPSNGRWSTAVFTIGNKGYVCTGAIDGSIIRETWEYDGLTDTWTEKANFPGSVRQDAVGFAINNKGYVGTGYSGGNTYTDFYEYDPVSDSWTNISSFPGPTRSGASAFTIGSKGYVGMGNATNSTSNYQDFYEYNPQNDTWMQKANYPLPYVVASSTYSSSADGYALGGYYYQFTGITHNPLNMFYKYNQGLDEWTLLGTFIGLPRGYAGEFGLNNDIYFGGGGQKNDGSASSMLSDFWKLSNGLTLRIEDPGTYSDFNLIPNPARETISFDNSVAGKKLKTLRIYDVSGKFIIEKVIHEANQRIDVSSFAAGLYFVELVTEKGEVLDSRFIKE